MKEYPLTAGEDKGAYAVVQCPYCFSPRDVSSGKSPDDAQWKTEICECCMRMFLLVWDVTCVYVKKIGGRYD